MNVGRRLDRLETTLGEPPEPLDPAARDAEIERLLAEIAQREGRDPNDLLREIEEGRDQLDHAPAAPPPSGEPR